MANGAAMTLEEVAQKLMDLTELVGNIAKECNIGHLVDPAKFPELAHLATGAPGALTPAMAAPANSAMPSPSSGNFLEFLHTGDQNGLVYFIATNQGTEPWRNPVTSGLIKVEASSIKKGIPPDVCDNHFDQQVFYTDNIPYSWVCIDFGNYRIKPTYYSMAHRAGPAKVGFFMRNWELHASNDSETWVVVRKHVDDQSLGDRAFRASWQVESLGLQTYRYFRIVIDPDGNSSHTSALVCSCFEIYGEWEFVI
uniref:F5/8 type C domain-containing protein n=1 Tax=Eutreptiella gymnastica TaxID=73025 RepID=A0A7S4GJP9_9EUGL|eukprot:CAMPEP_0174332966 /NCGR_PEP_ID=MMETSP0810-20121108/18740_1 /TAXON_ID=73025 ORGANISM="Eutreptiella gymnastica-like, Strain CCMP1594" /NCGR_SAMPLE_ID=MMETSP0810 /ASSEMBLY_ACC=CAM_ASM_000659 /LENGTH=252 /DNA_ID=CAMNT_0015449731 /DNA_START=27 /DNA_END=785 /DNA_ORIENTATION=-